MTFKQKAQDWARTLNIRWIAFAAWLLDVLSCLYMVRWWQAKDLGTRMMYLSMKLNQINPADVPAEAKTEFMGMAELLFAALLFALIITNTVFYIGYGFRKKWSIPYVTGYLITAAFIGISFLFEGFPVGGAWELVNLLGVPAYFVLGFVAWTLKRDLSPAGENPAR